MNIYYEYYNIILISYSNYSQKIQGPNHYFASMVIFLITNIFKMGKKVMMPSIKFIIILEFKTTVK